MSVIDEGRAARLQRDAEKRQHDAYNNHENYEHTVAWFYRDFYEHHLIANPDYRPGVFAPRSNPRRIVDPENPRPSVEGWRSLSGDVHAPSSFRCEGLEWRCVWKFHGTGGDLAYWDDGWWPEWYVRAPRRLRRPFRRWVQVHGPSQVAEAVA